VIAVFADTFYWVALTNSNDARYREAQALALPADATIVTTDEVLSEFLTFFSGESWLRQRAVQTVQMLLNQPGVRVIPQTRESFLAGLELYRSRPDKEYSLTDCISMHTMRTQGVADVLTNDRHFEQEGFRAVFRDLNPKP
jgi:predicted nucleic acid-binding protein